MKMKTKRKTDALVVLVLLGVFAVCILSVLLTGAEAYSRLSQRDRESYDRRTAGQYLASRVRQGDRLGGISTEEFGGCPALVLTEEIEGALYETRIYCYDGYLRELFAEKDSGLLPEDGEKVLPAESLLIEETAPGLHLQIQTGDGETRCVQLYLRSREGAAA